MSIGIFNDFDETLRDDFHLPHIDEDYIPIIANVCKGHATNYFDEVVKDFQENPCYTKNRPIRGEFLTGIKKNIEKGWARNHFWFRFNSPDEGVS